MNKFILIIFNVDRFNFFDLTLNLVKTDLPF